MRALIIGGGIAGPVTAMALQKAGIEAVVYEAYAASAGLDAGSYLTVAVNGLDALRTIDLHEAVMAAGFPSESISMFSGAGKPLGTVPIGGKLADGTVTHTIRRSDLYRIVHDEAMNRGIQIEHGKELVDAETTASGVTAIFADGSRASGDLMIGADGIHSRVRRLIDPAAPAPHYTGLGNIGGFSDAPSLGLAPGVYAMIFGKRAFFGYTVHPSGEIWWFANPPSKREIPRNELGAMTTSDWKSRLIDLFAVDHSPAAHIIQATSGDISASNAFDMPSVRHWHRDRMIIIGDAAHAASPSSGQGASMAMEDAVVLAICLRDHSEPDRAFTSFEQLRRKRVEMVVAEGAKFSNQKAPGLIGRHVRDLLMPIFLKRAAGSGDQSLAWLFNYHIEWSKTGSSMPVPA